MLSTNIILLAIVMVGLIYLYYNKNLREGLSTEQRNKWNANAAPSTLPCPEDKGGPIITYNGKNYRTLHGLCPNSVFTTPPGGRPQTVCEGDQEGNTAGQWPGRGPLPAGWEIAPDNADSIHVIKSNQWSTPGLATNAALVKGGRGGAYLTGNAQWQDADNTRGKPGDEWFQGVGWPAIIKDHGNQIYGTTNCALGILLSQNATPPVNCSCPSSWGACTASSGTCGPGTQTRTCTQASGGGTPCTAADESQSCNVTCSTCQACRGDQTQVVKVGADCPGNNCAACCGAAPTCATSSLSCQTDYTNAKSATTYDGTPGDFQSKCCTMNKCSPITYDTR